MLTVADIEGARARIRDYIYESPCAHSETFSQLTGNKVHFKLENLQMTGSFKERGAANLLLQLDADERRRGVAAASAGNHGLAVAFHAARLGIPATIVMPTYAPLIKVTSARRYGADVILHGANYDEAYERAQAVAAERGAVFVHPFDDARVVAGQGTLGLELLEQLDELDAVLVPVGGGGLIAGVALQDRPGALARLTALIAEERANILQIEHDRAFSRQPIGSTEVELTLETSGRKHIDALKQRLEAGGYSVEERGI